LAGGAAGAKGCIPTTSSIGDPARVIGEPVRISQILTNLLNNAVKITAQGAIAVRIELRRRRPFTAEILFTVTDTGIGNPADRLESSFNRSPRPTLPRPVNTAAPSWTDHQQTACQPVGRRDRTGSEVGKGSTFRFFLPLTFHGRGIRRGAATDFSGVQSFLARFDHQRDLAARVARLLLAELPAQLASSARRR
jgi:hypothetical protein